MNADSKLSVKCPSCGNTQQKPLSVIKAQKAFDCECGYHANLQPAKLLKPRAVTASPQPTTTTSSPSEKDDALAITA